MGAVRKTKKYKYEDKKDEKICAYQSGKYKEKRNMSNIDAEILAIYLAFKRYIYNLPEESGETYGVLGTTSLFPRISIYPNESPGFTAQLFKFGYLNRVYAKPNLQELSKLPLHLISSVKNYAQGDGVYCRFFSISMESKDLQVYFPTIN